MKKWALGLTLLFILVACAVEKPVQDNVKIENEVVDMKIMSNAFKQGGSIPLKFTCQGEDINPQLSVEGVPAGAKSLALIVDDPDAPAGTWVHWLVKDIPADIKEIEENSVPGNQVINSFGKEDYGGPCPPSGTHRYFFKLYALNVESFEANGKADFYKKVEQYAVAKAELMGVYKKS